MKTKTLAALILIVLLPLGLLGWLGVRLALDEDKLVEHRFSALIRSQLQAVDEDLQSYLKSLENELLAEGAKLSLNTGAIRQFIRRQPRVNQVFLFGTNGERLFPPLTTDLTEKEKRFLERTAMLWPENSTKGKIPLEQSVGDSKGWYVWFSGVEQNHIFWWRDPSGQLIGIELQPMRLLSDLIARLPASEATEGSEDRRIRLLNAQGTVVYQWGGFDIVGSLAPLTMHPLSHPLESWKLEYYAAPLGAEGLQWLSRVVAFLVAGCALFGLGFYLYREHRREVRLAEERVNFVNQVSHELKTPLTNIRLYAELLNENLPETDGTAEGDKPRHYLHVITSESVRLSRLIGNVLTFSRAEKNKLQVHLEPGCVDDIIKKTLAAFRPSFEARCMETRVQLNAPEKVNIDADALEQIMNNLLSNAEKYAASGKRLEVYSRQTETTTSILVKDRGPGISAKEAARVFVPFYRVSSKLTDGATGTGIGLSIAKQLAQLHGGDLLLKDSGPGACFEIRIETPQAGSKN